MIDTSSQPTLVEAITHLVLVLAHQFASQKSGDVSGFDRVNKGFQQSGVKILKRRLVLENQVGCIFGLHNAPVILCIKFLHGREILLG